MNILVFLPTTGRRIDAVSQIILARHQRHAVRTTVSTPYLSVLVSGNVRPLEFSLAAPGSSTNGFKHFSNSEFATRHAGPTRAPGADDDRAWRGAGLTGERLCKSIVCAERQGTRTLPESSVEALCILIWRRSYA